MFTFCQEYISTGMNSFPVLLVIILIKRKLTYYLICVLYRDFITKITNIRSIFKNIGIALEVFPLHKILPHYQILTFNIFEYIE